MSASHDAHDEGHGHGHGHSPFIQHHYDDAQHQFDSGKLGIWLFLAQEVLFFSALFVAYILYRVHHPEIYSYAHKYLDVKYGAINTGVLIFSSLTAAWAVRAAQLQQKKLLIACLATTILCAFGFLCIKYIEYTHKIHEHILPGRYFDPCVSSGGEELLTKKNECQGSKTTVVWSADLGGPESGCFPDFTVDTDLHKEGSQAQCKVREAKAVITHVPNADASGLLEHIDELEKKPIVNQCVEELFGEEGGGEKAAEKKTTTEAEHQKLPCWKVSRQPAVCKPGFFFTWTCEGKCDLKTVGGPSGIAGAFPNAQKCAEVKGDKEQAIKAAKDKGVVTDCRESDNAGILVEYGDKEERGELSREIDPAGMQAFLVASLTKKVETATTLAASTAEAVRKLQNPDEKTVAAAKAAADDLKKYSDALAKTGNKLSAEQVKDIGKSVGATIADQEKVTEIRIFADCAPAAKPEDPGDLMADRSNPLVLGKKAISPTHEMSVHEEHAREAAGPPPEHTNMFFTIYFAMTGLHGIHVLVGIFVFIWLLIRAIKGQFTPEYFGPIDYAALYWHIVDLIWIFLFPLLYLIH